MDENVMRVLQMLQEGKISAQEAETLIAALRGDKVTPDAQPEPTPPEGAKKGFFFNLDNIKSQKLDLDDLGERISRAVSKVQPEKILKRVQSEIRTINRSGASWSASVSSRVRSWTDGEDIRPTNPADHAEQVDEHEQGCHLDAGAQVMVENPLGDVVLLAADESTAFVVARKRVWGPTSDSLKDHVDAIEIAVHGTDSRLDIKVSAADFFRQGTVDLELKVPKSIHARISTRFGKIEITGIEGRAEAVTTSGHIKMSSIGADARCESASGSIHLEKILGCATVATQSGNIEARAISRGISANSASGDVCAEEIEGGRVECKSVSGDVTVSKVGLSNPVDITVESISGALSLADAIGNIGLKAVSGDVSADRITASRLQAQTVSGDVSVNMKESFSGTVQLNTVSGDVSLGLPEGSNARVTLGSTSGDLRCDHEATDANASDTLWTGQIGTGAGTITVQTLSGDAHILRV